MDVVSAVDGSYCLFYFYIRYYHVLSVTCFAKRNKIPDPRFQINKPFNLQKNNGRYLEGSSRVET